MRQRERKWGERGREEGMDGGREGGRESKREREGEREGGEWTLHCLDMDAKKGPWSDTQESLPPPMCPTNPPQSASSIPPSIPSKLSSLSLPLASLPFQIQTAVQPSVSLTELPRTPTGCRSYWRIPHLTVTFSTTRKGPQFPDGTSLPSPSTPPCSPPSPPLLLSLSHH